MMTGGTIDGIVFSCPRDIRKKFSDNKSVFCIFYVFPECPPPEIVGSFQFFVRTIEIRDIVF